MKNHNGDLSLDILLKAMKLPTIFAQYREVAQLAEREGWDFVQFLKELHRVSKPKTKLVLSSNRR